MRIARGLGFGFGTASVAVSDTFDAYRLVLPKTSARKRASPSFTTELTSSGGTSATPMLTPSNRRRRRRHHRRLLCRRLHLPLRLLPRLAPVEGGHRQLPIDKKGLSRGILDALCSFFDATRAIALLEFIDQLRKCNGRLVVLTPSNRRRRRRHHRRLLPRRCWVPLRPLLPLALSEGE
jgi:hypothetical protein